VGCVVGTLPRVSLNETVLELIGGSCCEFLRVAACPLRYRGCEEATDGGPAAWYITAG